MVEFSGANNQNEEMRKESIVFFVAASLFFLPLAFSAPHPDVVAGSVQSTQEAESGCWDSLREFLSMSLLGGECTCPHEVGIGSKGRLGSADTLTVKELQKKLMNSSERPL